MSVPGLVASVGLLGVLLALLLAPVQTAALALTAIAVVTGTTALRTALSARRQRRETTTSRRVCLPGTDVCIDG